MGVSNGHLIYHTSAIFASILKWPFDLFGDLLIANGHLRPFPNGALLVFFGRHLFVPL
jgi:hypothetical protein